MCFNQKQGGMASAAAPMDPTAPLTDLVSKDAGTSGPPTAVKAVSPLSGLSGAGLGLLSPILNPTVRKVMFPLLSGLFK